MAGIIVFASSVATAAGGWRSAGKVKASRRAGTSRNCRGRTPCEPLSLRHPSADKSRTMLSNETNMFGRKEKRREEEARRGIDRGRFRGAESLALLKPANIRE